jgi:hypothetical protein
MLHQEERQSTTTVELNGHNYYVVDQDRSKGDRRCDGKATSDFFKVEETTTIINNVRESKRVKKRKDQEEAAYQEQALAGSKLALAAWAALAVDVSVIEGSFTVNVNEEQDQLEVVSEVVSSKKKKRKSKIEEVMDDNRARQRLQKKSVEQNPVDGNGIPSAPFMLRPPESGVRCAGRHDTTRLLWLHEYYVVHEETVGKATKSIYQALQFMLGVHIPDGLIPNITELMRRSIWVLGIRYVAAAHVQQYRDGSARYIFHTEYNDEDARTCLFGTCPEVVRVENCLKWHEMKDVSTEVPRVVHAEDVQNRRLHVAGRANHYVCGVTAVEDLVTHTYSLARLPRIGFCMYPEERLGMEINSPSMMWEHIEEIFTKIRMCMSAARQGTSSATFSMPLLCTVYAFWQVSHLVLHIH